MTAFRSALDGLDDYFPEGDERVPGVDAIQSWAQSAVDSDLGDGGDRLAVWGDGLGLALVEGDRQTAVVWHHSSSMALDVRGEFTAIELVYEPSESDARRHRWHPRRLWVGDEDESTCESWVLLELNGIVGAESFRFRDTIAVPWRIARRSAKVALDVAGLPLKLVGGAVGTVGAALYTEKDQSASGRLAHEEKRARDVADAFPRLDEDAPRSDGRPVAVLVHGFGSCAMPAARALSRRGFGIPTYRFEHDTFLGIRTNARELARLVREVAPNSAILFLCHSRGGLVGRYAAAELNGRPASLVTLGTPHAGTPIAATWGTGAQVLSQFKNLYYDETESTGGTPHPGSVGRSFITRPYPPPGLTALRPNDEFFVNLAVDAPTGDNLAAYGGQFRAGESAQNPLSRAGGWFTSQFSDGLFDGEPNDQVVSTASATAVAPRGHTVVLKKSCAHSGYYVDKQALEGIDRAAGSLR